MGATRGRRSSGCSGAAENFEKIFLFSKKEKNSSNLARGFWWGPHEDTWRVQGARGENVHNFPE
ncbi:hypothetical protein KI387_038202, partial [Taxus chinensis]